MEKRGLLLRRTGMMLAGIVMISICVGCYRLSEFGVDAFTCMNLGISGYIGLSFGTWQLIMNAAILVVVFFTVRKCIGAGTIVNMVCVGYGADFLCWLVQDALRVEMTLPLRIGALVLGTFFASMGVAFYMAAEMGIGPYDSVGLVLEKVTGGRLPFRNARVLSDITAIIVGVVFCLLAGDSIWLILGIGTICNACVNGPLIQFFREHVSEPLVNKKK
ncbi:MAG TPA: hypothetical protein H9782_07045 [Candidatus Bariatricus faecipullorum]|nr:hypothetical protein [Candidatus Bariatricus faecipullorum]